MHVVPLKRICVNNRVTRVWMIGDRGACSATNPVVPNFSGHSRGRKLHLSDGGKFTVCGLLVDRYVPASDHNWSFVLNGRCAGCFPQRHVVEEEVSSVV